MPAQEADRVLHFTATKSPKDFEAIATMVQVTSDIPKAVVDSSEQALTLHGTAEQVALAEWLFANLDKPTNVPPSGARHEYRMSDSPDGVVGLFYLKNPEIPTGVQEIAMAVRSVVDVRRMFTYNELRAIAVRGTEEQIMTVEFLFTAMDMPAIQQETPASPEFRMNQQPGNLVRVFYLPNTKTFQDFQEVVMLVRTLARLRYAFTYSAPRAVGVRGTDEQIALAKWLFDDVDRAKSPDSSVHQYQVPSTSDDFVRVFYLAHAKTSQRLADTLLQIQRKTHNAWVCLYNAPSAIAIRGTAQEIAHAAQLIEQEDK